MKFTVVLSVLLATAVAVSVKAQTNTTLNQATLYFQQRGADVSMSSINFEITDKAAAAATGFDLTYGGWASKETGGKWKYQDWLRVMDPRSMIVDLGKKDWNDFKDAPAFPKQSKSLQPLPLTHRPIVIAPGSREVSPYRQLVTAKARHMYLVRLFHESKVIYVMFRVETLASGDNCVLAWKKVTPAKVVNEK